MAAKRGKRSIKPIKDNLLIERLEAESKTAGGILLPDAAKEKPREGKVLAVGPGATLESGERKPFQVEVGDRVLFSSYAGTEITIDGKEYLLMTENDILAVMV
ncbi:MAG: co-chaperone GroES [Alphaproteobacteria bacterium]